MKLLITLALLSLGLCTFANTDSVGDFVLLETGPQGEIWKDMKTGLIWGGDSLPTIISQSDAKKACARLEKFGKKSWRLPTIEEFKTADEDGLRSAMPSMADIRNYLFWSSSSTRVGRWVYALLFVGYTGGIEHGSHQDVNGRPVRCVTR